jgi:hypothetical protein
MVVLALVLITSLAVLSSATLDEQCDDADMPDLLLDERIPFSKCKMPFEWCGVCVFFLQI